jgi:DNA-binding NarL/FixJ family response regulator
VESRPRLRVLIADDHALVRDGLRRLINDQSDMVVVGEVTNGGDAVAEAQRLSPRVVLIDISMPGPDGITVARAITAVCPDTKIIAVSRHTDLVFVTQMMRAGAAGYVLKQSPSAELLQALRAVANGHEYIDVSLKGAPASDVAKAPDLMGPAVAREPLKPLEEAVLQLVARAHSNHEISEQIGVVVDDVASIKSIAMRKAGLKTRVDVIEYAHQRGWA